MKPLLHTESNNISKDIYLVMGVMASGKTSIASELAKTINGKLIEADDLHSEKNKALMAQGVALTDEDRWPWLQSIVDTTLAIATQHPIIIACSALKISYRAYLRKHLGKITIIYLDATPELIAQRAEQRSGHFMSPNLIESQFSTLEAPNITTEPNVVSVDITATKSQIIQQIIKALPHNLLSQ